VSSTAVLTLAAQLDRVAIDLRRRPPDAELDDILDGTLRLERDVSAIDSPAVTARWHLNICEILFRQQRDEEAVARAQLARKATERLPTSDMAVAAFAAEARALLRLRNWEQLNTVADAGIKIAESQRASVSPPYLRASYLRDRVVLYEAGARAALEMGDVAAYLVRTELAKCRHLAVPQRIDGDNPEVRRIEVRLRGVSGRIALARQRSPTGEAPADLLAERRALWDAFMIAGRNRSELPQPDLAAIQQCLGKGEAAISYFWLDRWSLGRMVLDTHRVYVDLVSLEPDRRFQLETLAAGFMAAEARVETYLPTAIDNFRDLLWPEHASARAILADADRLILSPHRLLHALPLGTLAIDGQLVIDRWAVRFAPNLATLCAATASGGQGAALSIGVRDYSVPGLKLGPLPQAVSEAAEVQHVYRSNGRPAVCLVDKEATRDAIGKAIAHEAPTIVHIACHGMSVPADTPLEARLALAEQAVDGLDLVLFGLRPETVVLSACCAGQRSIAGRGLAELPGDDLLGLPAAFLASGVREVVATHFACHDETARILMTAFHRHLVAGAPADIALARAMRSFKTPSGSSRQRRSRLAPFFLIALGQSRTENDPSTGESDD
jgi:hypothetical protein